MYLRCACYSPNRSTKPDSSFLLLAPMSYSMAMQNYATDEKRKTSKVLDAGNCSYHQSGTLREVKAPVGTALGLWVTSSEHLSNLTKVRARVLAQVAALLVGKV